MQRFRDLRQNCKRRFCQRTKVRNPILQLNEILHKYFCSIRQEVRSSGDGSPTLECLRECDRLRERCLSVVIMADRFSPELSRNGTSGAPRMRCFILDRSASADSTALSFTPNSVYYEKTCLPGKFKIFVHKRDSKELKNINH